MDVAFKSVGAIQAHYNTRMLANLVIPVPPLSEQTDILAALAIALKPIDVALAGAVREISLLREYRTRLIADVVTGKRDVREVAANLSDEPEEPRELDELDAAANADKGTEIMDDVEE